MAIEQRTKRGAGVPSSFLGGSNNFNCKIFGLRPDRQGGQDMKLSRQEKKEAVQGLISGIGAVALVALLLFAWAIIDYVY